MKREDGREITCTRSLGKGIHPLLSILVVIILIRSSTIARGRLFIDGFRGNSIMKLHISYSFFFVGLTWQLIMKWSAYFDNTDTPKNYLKGVP